jgi:hypothetical protein
MPIRKEGSVTGKVIEIDDDDLIRKTAATDPPWDDTDEQALAQENADQG